MNYGRSKQQMEELLQEAFQAGKIETVILRPCWFYGPEQPPRQTRFFKMIKEGKAPIVGSGEARRERELTGEGRQTVSAEHHVVGIEQEHERHQREHVRVVAPEPRAAGEREAGERQQGHPGDGDERTVVKELGKMPP